MEAFRYASGRAFCTCEWGFEIDRRFLAAQDAEATDTAARIASEYPRPESAAGKNSPPRVARPHFANSYEVGRGTARCMWQETEVISAICFVGEVGMATGEARMFNE